MSQENTTSKQPLIRYVNRQQMSWRVVDVENLIGEDHPARALWTLVGRLDLSPFYRAIESSMEEGGRPAFDPQLVISLWVHAYSQGSKPTIFVRPGHNRPTVITEMLCYNTLSHRLPR